MAGFGPIAAIPVAALPVATGSVMVGGALWSPTTQNAVYIGATFTGSGGTAPYTYTASWGSLVGLTINSSTGLVSGTVTSAPGIYTGITITATDSVSVSGTTPGMSLTVLAPGITQRSRRAETMRKFWWRPRPGPPPRRRKTTQFVPQPNLDVFKFNTYDLLSPPDDSVSVFKFNDYTVLSPPDDSLSVFKFNVYVVLEATLPRPLRRVRHQQIKAVWRWRRPKRFFAPPISGRRPILFVVT